MIPILQGVFCPIDTSKAHVLPVIPLKARGDQCDACGATYEAIELKNPISKMNPDSSIEIRDTEHMFYRLDLFQNVLEEHALAQHSKWEVKCPRYDKNNGWIWGCVQGQ